MSTTVSRLDFMKASLAGMAAVAVSGCATTSTAAPACAPKGACGEKKPIKFKFGLAGYTMHKKTLDETLAVLRKTDIHYLCVKDFHLPLKATDAEMAAFKEKCAKAGVNPYAAGPLYTKTNEDVRRFFEYAKRFGFKTVVGVPYKPGDEKDKWNKRLGSREQLEYIDKLVKEFDIRYAIHNHGPAIASKANIAVPPAGNLSDEILIVPGHIIPTEKPQIIHPIKPVIGFDETEASR